MKGFARFVLTAGAVILVLSLILVFAEVGDTGSQMINHMNIGLGLILMISSMIYLVVNKRK